MELAREKPRFGYRRLDVLLAGGGERVNQKRLFRVYQEAGLGVRRKARSGWAGTAAASVDRSESGVVVGFCARCSREWTSHSRVDGGG